MTFTNSDKLYTKYLKIQAAEIDLEAAAKKAEDICERIRNLTHCAETTIEWCSSVECAIGTTVEYINLCVYLCRKFGAGPALIISDVIGVIVALCDLKHSISTRKGCDKRRESLLTRISEAICDAGSSIKIQDQKYWLCISELFDLENRLEIKIGFEFDAALLASGKSIKDNDNEQENLPKEEPTIENEALKVLKEAMDLKDPLISTSWVQRKFGYGYIKSLRLLDWLAERHYVQSFDDMQAEGLHGRRILVTKDML